MYSFPHRKGNKTFWAVLPLSIIIGLVAGFAVPLLASRHSTGAFVPARVVSSEKSVAKVVPVVHEASASDLIRDLQLENLSVRNRRLEALVASLRQKNAELANQPMLDERGPQY
jgi:hypothetical protein